MANNYKGEDRRAVKRFRSKGVRMVYERESGFFFGLFGGKGRDSKPVPVRNMGRDGLCFLSQAAFKPGQELRATVRLGHGKPVVKVEGSVRWVGPGEGVYPYKVGVGFTNISPPSWEVLIRLERYLSREKDWKHWRLRSKDHWNRAFGEPTQPKEPPEG